MAFVGRERELAQLAEAVRRVAQGGLGRVVLTGPAGIGCTRLLDELFDRVKVVPGVVACRGRAYAPGAGVAYQALGDALDGALRGLSDERLLKVVGACGRDLSLLVPAVTDRLDEIGVDRRAPRLIAPDQLGRRVVESILGVLERLAGNGVLLLTLEDLHLADPGTRALVRALQTVGRSLPICLVVSYQPDMLHRRHPVQPLADWLADDPAVQHVALGPLGARDIEQLVSDAAEVGSRANFLPSIVEGARGNPLVALWLASSTEIVAGIRLSDPFDELCGARLEALPRDAVRVVRTLSAAAMPLTPASLLRVQLPEGRPTIQGLEAAIGSGFVVEHGEQVAIAHELLAEAVDSLELMADRRGIHMALARQLAAQPAVAAWHWARARRPVDARDASIRAATAALHLDPAETVLGHYEEALELPGLDELMPEERAALWAGAAAASASAGRFRRAASLQRRAIENRARREASSERGGRDAATRLLLGEMYADLGRYQWAGGELEGAIESMERALGIMPAHASRIRARAQAALAQHLMIAGRFEESAALAREARDTATAAAVDEGTQAELGHAICTLGMDVAYLGDLEGGLALLERSASIAREAGRLDDLMRVAANRTTLLDLDSRREEALAVVHASLEDAAVGGLAASYGAFLRGNSADILYHLGRWQEAEAECRLAQDWRMSALEAEWWPPLVLGLVLTESRGDEEAERLVGQALLQLDTVQPGQWTGHVLRSAISVALWARDPGGALAIAEREWPRALESDELAVVAWAASSCLEAAAAAADHGRQHADPGLIVRARDLASRILPEASAHVAGSAVPPSLGARQEAELHLVTARAHAHRIRGRVDARTWDGLATAWARRPMPYQAAKARWWQALAILGAAHDDEREAARAAAREPLAEAFRLARDLPALPLLREVVDLAARARVALPLGPEVEALLEATRRVGLQREPAATPGGPSRGERHADEARAPLGRRGEAGIAPGGRRTIGAGRERDLVAVGPGPAPVPVPVGPGTSPPEEGPPVSDLARAIEERILATLRRHPSDVYGLSPREQEVLNILAEGRTDRDIAARLFISERTVHVHVRRILAKLGVSSRTEAAGVAIRQGLVPADLPDRSVAAQSVVRER
jgi:DNA-binding CsgD family transcriptional regulator/tetratricopeptide (TPR) repeat protein